MFLNKFLTRKFKSRIVHLALKENLYDFLYNLNMRYVDEA